MYPQLLTNGGAGVWQRRSLLVKLSAQTQLLEELAEISVDRLGAITSAADGTWQPVTTSLVDWETRVVKNKNHTQNIRWLQPVTWCSVVPSQSSRASPSAPSWWPCGRSAAGLQDSSTPHWTECSNTWTSATRPRCRRDTHTALTQVGASLFSFCSQTTGYTDNTNFC